MPNSPPSPSSEAGGLRAFLNAALPNAQLSDAPVNAEYQPLLLMQTKHVVAAFAFANGDTQKSYEALYGSFKQYYTAQRDEWDTLDLAFVFCVQPGVRNLDHFSSTIETDVYFCRKFVVALAAPLGKSLARLPFLPLVPLHGQSMRPASAQTFLQQCGVPAMLAKYLVVQHARSPTGIVEDCTTGEFGEPRELTYTKNAPVLQSDRAIEPIRLETVEIENFRAYRKPQSFTLGADVTMLYGPNGFGKTSFFDAVDFGITGGIGRIDSRRAVDFAKSVQHLDSGSEESTVSLAFRCDGAVRKVMRTVGDRNQASLDGRAADRKAILTEITAGNIPATDRVDNFVSLFRASHLFSQEQQELTKDMQKDCSLPRQIVARMLAFEDYANAVDKAGKVHTVVQSAIADASQEIRILSEEIKGDKKELERLNQKSEARANVGALDAEIEALQAKLAAVGIAIPEKELDATIVRGWRATLESRHAESQSASRRLTVLAKEVASVPATSAELASVQQQIAQKEGALKVCEEKRVAAEMALQFAEQLVAEMSAKIAAAEARKVLLEWVRTAKSVYLGLVDRQRVLAEELRRATDAESQQQAATEKADGDLRSREAAAVQSAEKQKGQREQLAILRRLQESIPAWQSNRARLANAIQMEKAAIKSLEALQSQEREFSPLVGATAAEDARLSRQIADADKNQSELRILVSQLQGHVHNGICPLCGEDHGAKEQLLHRIEQHVATDAASGARADLTRVRERAKQFAERIAANKEQQQAVHTQLAALNEERARLDTEIARCADTAAKLRVAIEETGLPTAEQMQSLIDHLQRDIVDVSRQYQDAATTLEAARTAAANAKNVLAATSIDVANRKTGLARIQEESNGLRADPRLTQISLDIDADKLAENERLNLAQLVGFKTEAAKAGDEATKKKPEISALRQEAASLKSQLSGLRNQLTNLQRTLAQIKVRREEAKLPIDANEETILALIAQQSREQAQLLALRDSASNIELAIDAATTAAALTTLLANIRNKENALTRATQKSEQHQPWLKYFAEVLRLVSSQQNEAIANFTHEYGPRTSVIQRRLRSVYGFDEIEIQSRESTISVRVKRHGQELRPTDYFSQSQQQTLLLALFLTACSSQTWSAFSPVLLDDPVTHFDDLNTYAFLDLIVGLLESEFGKRQFIISTCDDKLLQLARQKFRHLGERATFYRFGAIGPEGPTVEKVDP